MLVFLKRKRQCIKKTLIIRFQDCVHSRKFQSLGLPIGSGEIESAHKYIPQKRLKIPGATWHPNVGSEFCTMVKNGKR